VIGMLRKQESKSFFQPSNAKESNQWYFVDIQEIADHLGTTPVLVDAITRTAFSSASVFFFFFFRTFLPRKLTLIVFFFFFVMIYSGQQWETERNAL
jgi:hypothetical protein